MLTLELYRSKLPEPEGRWFVVLSRNKKGAVHTQKDVTDLFEQRFQEELNDRLTASEQIWQERLERETARGRNLQDRLAQVLADKEAQSLATGRLLQEKDKNWQQKVHEEGLRVSESWEKRHSEQVEIISKLQAEVREKVSKIKKLNDLVLDERTKHLSFRNKVDQTLVNGQWGDEQMLHEGRRQWKLENGYVLPEYLPWYRRLFRKPDQDLLLYSKTTDEHKDLCRFTYGSVLRGLQHRLGL